MFQTLTLNEGSTKPNEITYSLMIQANKRNWGRALFYFHQMEHASDMKMNTIIYSQIISVLGTFGKWEQALRIYNRMNEVGVKANKQTCSALIKAFSRAGLWRDAMRTYDAFSQKGLKLDVLTLNAVIDACRRSSRWEEGLRFLLTRGSLQTANIVTFNTLMGACQTLNQSLRLFTTAMDQELKPDIITYNTLIHKCTRSANWQKAVWFHRHMRQSHVQPDSLTYNTMIHAFGKARQWLRSVSMIRYMESQRLRPDLVTYNSAMLACKKARKPLTALKLFENMTSSVGRDAASYSTIIATLGHSGMWEKAYEIFLGMPSEADLAGNLIIWNSMLDAFAKGKEWRKAHEFFSEMQKNGVGADVYTFSTMINAYVTSGRWNNAMKAYRAMKSSGIEIRPAAITPILPFFEHLAPDESEEIMADFKLVGMRTSRFHNLGVYMNRAGSSNRSSA